MLLLFPLLATAILITIKSPFLARSNNLFIVLLSLFAILLSLRCKQKAGPGTAEHLKSVTAAVDDKPLLDADKNPGNWLSDGRHYSEDQFRSLDQATKENVNKLGLPWSLDPGFKRVEATPIVVDGIMFISGAWIKVYAIDARTGQLMWTYDPKVPGRFGMKACCDVLNQGAVLCKGKVYAGTLDGRLIASNAVDGKPVWEVLTVDTTKYYTITSASRVMKGKIIIRNGCAEFVVR